MTSCRMTVDMCESDEESGDVGWPDDDDDKVAAGRDLDASVIRGMLESELCVVVVVVVLYDRIAHSHDWIDRQGQGQNRKRA